MLWCFSARITVEVTCNPPQADVLFKDAQGKGVVNRSDYLYCVLILNNCKVEGMLANYCNCLVDIPPHRPTHTYTHMYVF